MFDTFEKCLESGTVPKANLVQLRGLVRTITLCTVQNGTIENFSNMTVKGVSARVLSENKSWGFSSINHVEKENVEECLKMALKLSLASVNAKRQKIMLEPIPAEEANVSTSAKKPFEKADLEDIKEIPLEAHRGALEAGRKIANVKASFLGIQDQKWFASSEGSRIFQGATRLLLMVDVVAKEGSLYCPASENLGHTGGLEIFDESPPRVLGKTVAQKAARLFGAASTSLGKIPCDFEPNYLCHFAARSHWASIRSRFGYVRRRLRRLYR